MVVSIVFILFLGLIVASLVQRKHRRNNELSSVYNLPPCPRKLPIVGHCHHIGALSHRYLWSLSQNYGPILYLQLGVVPTVVVSSAAMAKEILKTHDLDCCSRPPLLATSKYSYGCLDIGFAPYGEYWREMRKKCILELFSVKKLQSFRSIREEEAALMLDAVSNSYPNPVNLSKMVHKISMNVICRAAFGESRNAERYDKSKFHRILEEQQAIVAGFFFSDYFPGMGWLDKATGMLDKLNKNFYELDAFYEYVVEAHLNSETLKTEQEDLVDALLKLQTEANLSRDHIKAILTDVFIAGTETSTAVIVWTMTELIRNPAVMKKVQHELREYIGSKGKVDEDDLGHLQYLQCVVKETMRMHTPVPLLLPHETIRHCKIGGYDVLPKSKILINAWAIARDPISWKKPEEFLPERFAESAIDVKGHDFELIPFGSGRRVCPGLNLGMRMIDLVLANLLYSFDWKLPDNMKNEEVDMTVGPGIVLRKKVDLFLVGTKSYIK